MLAAKNGDIAVRQLLNAGAVVDAKENQHGRTALHIASEHRQDEIAQALGEAGANIEARNDGGATPLIVAAAAGHNAVLSLLFEYGVCTCNCPERSRGYRPSVGNSRGT